MALLHKQQVVLKVLAPRNQVILAYLILMYLLWFYAQRGVGPGDIFPGMALMVLTLPSSLLMFLYPSGTLMVVLPVANVVVLWIICSIVPRIRQAFG